MNISITLIVSLPQDRCVRVSCWRAAVHSIGVVMISHITISAKFKHHDNQRDDSVLSI